MKSIFAPERSGRAASPASLNQMTRPTGVVTNGFAKMNVVVDWTRREVRHRDGRRCELSTREADLLACLARKPGTPVSRAEILAQVWKLDPRRTATRSIDMHISLLRKKLGDIAKTPMVLLTVHGVGYMLHGGGNGSNRTLQFENERGPARNGDGRTPVNG